MRSLLRLALLPRACATLALVAGCASTPVPASDASPDALPADAAVTDAPNTDAPAACTNSPADVEITAINTVPAAAPLPAVTAYHVVYTSTGGIRVHGQICVPESPGPHAIVVYNHGGFEGLGAREWTARAPSGGAQANTCYTLGAQGYVVVQAQYRGETDAVGAPLGTITSEGNIEVCAGEADDVLALLAIARNRCDVDPNRVAVFGGSHGGCITLQVLRRHPAGVRAGAALVPPTSMGELYRYHLERGPGSTAPPDGCDPRTIHQGLADLIAAATGSTDPTSAPYAARSPALSAPDLAPIPFMVLFGQTDCLVPLSQGCALRTALQTAGIAMTDYHLDTNGNPITTAIPGCNGAAYTAGPWPGAAGFTGDRYFIALDGQGHSFTGAPAMRATEALGSFLLSHLQ